MDNLKILVVEDNRFFREFLTAKLKAINSSYNIENVESFKEAIDKTKQMEFDAIIIDYVLQGKNGLELLDEFKNTGMNKPVIIVTALKDTDVKGEAMRKGASGFISKPINYDELHTLINEVVENKNTQ